MTILQLMGRSVTRRWWQHSQSAGEASRPGTRSVSVGWTAVSTCDNGTNQMRHAYSAIIPTIVGPLERVLVVVTVVTAVSACGTPDYVGLRDCAKLSAELEWPEFLKYCEMCQGKTCDGEEGACKLNFPCEQGKYVVQGCEEDSDCSELKALCGMYIGPDNICTVNDTK